MAIILECLHGWDLIFHEAFVKHCQQAPVDGLVVL